MIVVQSKAVFEQLIIGFTLSLTIALAGNALAIGFGYA